MKLNKKYKQLVAESENNKIDEECNINKLDSNLVNNPIPNSREHGESSRRNTKFMRPKYIPFA